LLSLVIELVYPCNVHLGFPLTQCAFLTCILSCIRGDYHFWVLPDPIDLCVSHVTLG